MYPNSGICMALDKEVEVKGGILGDQIQFQINKIKDEKYKGILNNVIEKGNYDMNETCKHYTYCGGCSMLQISYDYQIKLKEEGVLNLFEREKIFDINYEGITRSPEIYEYRNKMEYTFGDFEKGGNLTLGLHVKKKSFSIITTDRCKLVHEDFLKIIAYTEDYFNKMQVPHYKIMKREGYLRNLVIRKGKNTGEILINLITTSKSDFKLDIWCDCLLNLDLEGKIKGIIHTINDSLSESIFADEVNVLYGVDYIYEIVNGLKFKIYPFSFFQTNTKGTELLYDIVKDFLGDCGGVIFDLYCGTGTIGQIISKCATKVYGIEIVEEAIKAAEDNAKLNNIYNCEFIAGDVEKVILSLNDKPDAIILDPPRPGVLKKALNKIIDFNAEKIIYISCNPKTMVEDLKILIENNYKIKRTKLMDLFPNTYHVEAIVLLQRT